MTTSAAQYPVLVSILPGHNVQFTYFDEASNGPVTSPSISLNITCPTDCLFILDYATSKAGWTITEISAVGMGSPTLNTLPGPKKLSLMVMDPYLTLSQYKYYLHFANGKEKFKFDPQETNVRN
ncbi:hypothetical protein NHH88_22510 [Oxalobacteraceae bacterium OTU3CAMAD1]|nr:hypothetical protein NHH88_22510 [Oxalobacteraceae bacterium OTU3CAMAD1]